MSIIVSWFRRRILALSILAASLCITWLLWQHEQSNAVLDLQAQLDSDLRDASGRIEQRMAAYKQMLRGAQGLFAASGSVGREEFRAYVDSLHLGADFSGVEGIAVALIVPHAEKDSHIAALRNQGFSEYAIQPQGERVLYAPVIQMEPFVGRNLRAPGFDPYAIASRRVAMDRARDANTVVITGKIKLVLETDIDVQPGFMMSLPIYRKGRPHDTVAARRANILGWVLAPIRMNNFMSSLYGERASATDISIYDGVELTDQSLLYDSAGSHGRREKARLEALEYIDIAGHSWTLKIRAQSGFAERISSDRSNFIATAGIGLSLLLALFTSSLVAGRERARTQSLALQEAKEHFELIFNGSPDCSFISRMHDGCVTNVNNGIAVLGYSSDEVIGSTTLDINIWENSHERKKFIDEIGRKGYCENMEARFQRKDGNIFTGVISAKVTVLHGVQHIISVIRDNTEQHRAETELRLRGAALEATANAITITNTHGLIEWANPAFCNMTGYTMAETVGHYIRDLLKSGAQKPESYVDLWSTILAGKVWHGEFVNRRKDGTHYHEDQTVTPVHDREGAISHFVAVKQDITERKLSEARMNELSRHLLELQEDARRRLASELHDRTSPNLAAISINLEVMAGTMLGDSTLELAARLEDTRALIEDTTASIREICADLRPPVLDYAGLLAALESYAHQFSRRTGISVLVESSDCADRLSPELESALFRIAQEALTNCAKHANATTIRVAMRQAENTVMLAVEDNGGGFDPAMMRGAKHSGGLGIITMRELAEFSGGTFSIASGPGKGTAIRVEIDFNKGHA